jgi:hypothetical protein
MFTAHHHSRWATRRVGVMAVGLAATAALLATLTGFGAANAATSRPAASPDTASKPAVYEQAAYNQSVTIATEAHAAAQPHARSAPAATTTVSVPAAQPFTDTGIALTAGEHFSVSAAGTPCYHSGTGCYGPDGLTFRSSTGDYACSFQQYTTNDFTAPGLNCWSLIGRIGDSGVIFQVGNTFKLTSPVSGELYLGANDNYYPDNSGAYTATITTP